MQSIYEKWKKVYDAYAIKMLGTKKSRSPKGCGLVRAAFSRPASVCPCDSAAQGVFVSLGRRTL